MWRRGELFSRHEKPGLGLNRLSTLVDGEQLLQVGLHDAQAGIDGGIAETMREEVKVCQTRVGVVGISGLDVAGTTNGIEHCLQLGNNEPEVVKEGREGGKEGGRRGGGKQRGNNKGRENNLNFQCTVLPAFI